MLKQGWHYKAQSPQWEIEQGEIKQLLGYKCLLHEGGSRLDGRLFRGKCADKSAYLPQ